jgi:hypothetical protein
VGRIPNKRVSIAQTNFEIYNHYLEDHETVCFAEATPKEGAAGARADGTRYRWANI